MELYCKQTINAGCFSGFSHSQAEPSVPVVAEPMQW